MALQPEPEGLNNLCAGYMHFFRHIDPHMRFMACELRAGRPPANIMRIVGDAGRVGRQARHTQPGV